LRVLLNQWQDKYEGKGTMITHQQSVCPDDACQEIVNQKFAAIKELRESMEERRKNLVLRKRNKVI
jgi:hypothetical protein